MLVNKICSLLAKKGYSFANNQLITLEPVKTFINSEWTLNVIINTKDQESFALGFILENI